jgi:hypothetical protein
MDTREAGALGGRIGGKSRSAAKVAACRRNGFKPKRATVPEFTPKVAAPKYVLSPSPSTPAPVFDELDQTQ